MRLDDGSLGQVISWAALLFSGIALFVSLRLQRRQSRLLDLQIQAHDKAAAASKRANVLAELVASEMWGGGPRRHSIVLRNAGPVEARNVRLEFPNDDSPIPGNEADDKLPVRTLQPGGKLELVAAISMGNAGPFEVVISWDDASGHNAHEATIA